MSLKHRKIQKGLEAHNQTCVANLNEKLGTQFTCEVDWSCLPENISGWNWSQPDLDQLLYNSLYKPIEAGLQELMADEMYKEAILEQVKGIAVVPGRRVADYEIADGMVKVQHTLGVNQGGNFCGPFFNTFVKNFKGAIENGLS